MAAFGGVVAIMNYTKPEEALETPVPLGVLETFTPTPSLTPEETLTPLPSSTATPTTIFSPTPVASPSLEPTSSSSATPVASPTPFVTSTPTPSPSPTPSPAVLSAQNTVPTATPDVWPPSVLEPLFERYAAEFGVDKNTLERIANCESHFNPNAKNGDYLGMFQFATSSWISTRNQMVLPSDPSLRTNSEESIKTAAFMLSKRGTSPWPSCVR